MLYLADANVLITAHNSYYAVDRVPEYWEWLSYVASQGRVKMPFEILEEVKEGPDDAAKDLLFAWLQVEANKKALLFDEKVDIGLVQKVIAEGYAPDLTDYEVEEIGRDAFLIAYCLAGPGRCVVTVETSAPKRQRQNRRIPDVCKTMGVTCCNPFEFNRALGFRTQWKLDLLG
jgi:Domain of unknown function (DUF4411)